MQVLDLPQEVRVLNVTTELVESAVNHLICCFYKNDDDVVIEVKPKNEIEKKYFYVLLLEFVAGVNTEMIPAKNDGDNLLTLIRRITENPQLSTQTDNVKRLSERSQQFIDWLSHEFSYDLHSVNIRTKVCIRISRKDTLYLVGNRCKHSLTRSNAITKKLLQIYRASGITIPKEEETLVLEDIDNWFLTDFCGYHFTKICELCSNLYHAIIEYVRPEYESQAKREGGAVRSYDVPGTLTRSDCISEFYELLNKVGNPWVPIIQTPQIHTLRY